MLITLAILLSTAAPAQDCATTNCRSLMDILNDMQAATEQARRESEEQEVEDSAEPETPLAPVEPERDAGPRAYVSAEQEYAPVQRAGGGLPTGASSVRWVRPSTWTWHVAFSGRAGRKADHEGVDYVHDDPSTQEVPVVAAADGEVVYVRAGCPQSGAFGKNRTARECGSGWGNHVIVHHGDGVYIRYAHLDPEGLTVGVGDSVLRGQQLGLMGNSGRSETRHLHWELGTKNGGFDPAAPAQSFDAVYDPGALPFR